MVGASEAFRAWASEFEWLSDVEIAELEPWNRHVAFVVQFGLMTMGGGAGSLFYNYPERVAPVAKSLDAIGEPGLALQARQIDRLLRPLCGSHSEDVQGVITEEVLSGIATLACAALDTELNAKWQSIQERLALLARKNGWSG